MESADRADFVNPREPNTLDAADRTLATPNFDEKSIHRARPAVPLAHGTARASRPLPLVALAVAAGLVGGLVAILALTFYERRAYAPAQTSVAATQTHNQQTAQPAAANDAQTTSAQATSAQTSPAQTTVVHTNAPAPLPDAAALRTDASPDGSSTADARGDDTAKAAADGRAASSTQDRRAATEDESRELRAALSEWVTATNARDIDRQMKFYEPRVASYYLSRNASREAVRAEKEHVFARASAVDVRAGDPDITLGPDGQTAIMRFRKDYSIAGDGLDKRGAVIQELRWRRTPKGWRITSERDLRVVP